ncbi:riboflavin biosynthesis protein RibD [Cellulomonas chitinilytica]|uniref:Riboflavin biosynthesis protein RibD n=1 Tax=Cellulomonas chitinilytica TaxID=398759 RepID=A0A919U285_9CELL|nr:dihydrofolate reductase family protein [Cellulomonas chitinilytica]GIG22116.1 riboflavin biosynthesis protein RibD [Cellulomonas chitinilytica]
MRTLTLGMNVSLDGFVATPEDGLDWMFPNFSDELMADTQTLLSGFGTILMGRVNYEGQAATWPHQQGPLADIMNAVEKVVFSTTLQTADWQNTRVHAEDPAVEIARLKALDGPTLGASGGATFARYLTSHGLVDEYRLTVHPVFLGSGKPIFAERTALEPLTSTDYPNGVVVRTFRPKQA